jgi:hypothetical protein
VKKTAILLLFVVLAGASEERTVRPYVGLWGAHSKVKRKSFHRITTPEAWTALWLRHRGREAKSHSAYYNEAGVPDIDFERCMVVAIFQGEAWNSAGVKVLSVTEDEARLLLQYDDRSYQTAGPNGGGVRVTAFGFFVLPKSTRELVVEENLQGLKGRPDRYRERARFPALR